MRRLRSKAEQGPLGRSQTSQTKQEITQAGAFLTWLADRGRTIEHCQQADLDAWHTEKLATRRPAQTFLRWCMKTSRMSRLTLPPQVINQDQAPLHQHRRLAILRRALNDDSLPLRARVAAALVLLYAQPVNRIVRLTVDDVLDDGATVAVRLGDPPWSTTSSTTGPPSPCGWEIRRPRCRSPSLTSCGPTSSPPSTCPTPAAEAHSGSSPAASPDSR
ncbi:hypothetical protein GCM10010267_65480 [Streptomyces griseorubens]|nr:hypothetical protein GCM10010267_65480 [Streptomyces griseorubens]